MEQGLDGEARNAFQILHSLIFGKRSMATQSEADNVIVRGRVIFETDDGASVVFNLSLPSAVIVKVIINQTATRIMLLCCFD